MAEFGGWVPKSEAWTWNVGTAAMGLNVDIVLPMGVLRTGCTSLLQYCCATRINTGETSTDESALA